MVGVELVGGQIAPFVSLGKFDVQNEDENSGFLSTGNYSEFWLTVCSAAIDQVEPNGESRWTEMTEAAVAIEKGFPHHIWLMRMPAAGAPTSMKKLWYRRCWMAVGYEALTY